MSAILWIRVVCVCGVSVFFENAVVCVCCVSPLFSNDIVCVCDVSVLRNYTYDRVCSVSALEKRTVVGVCACDVSFMCLRFRKYLISSFLDKKYGSWKYTALGEYIQFKVENIRSERKLYGPLAENLRSWCRTPEITLTSLKMAILHVKII